MDNKHLGMRENNIHPPQNSALFFCLSIAWCGQLEQLEHRAPHLIDVWHVHNAWHVLELS